MRHANIKNRERFIRFSRPRFFQIFIESVAVESGMEAEKGSSVYMSCEQSEQSYDDQVDRNDEIQQARHHQNQNAGDQRDQWAQVREYVHGVAP
ncbi:UNVERIFIED_ORG: hypothetical protein J2791_002441 [Burkholderia contaminans]|nr:hypothetical protein [Burkholderia contaminans]